MKQLLRDEYGFTVQNMLDNFALLTDGYKFTHHFQRPYGVQTMDYYFESRGSVTNADGTVRYKGSFLVGLRAKLLMRLCGVKITRAQVLMAEKFVNSRFPTPVFNTEDWMHIVDEYGGKLPLEIRAVPEGTFVPSGNVMWAMKNIGGEKTAWLPGYVETTLSHVWLPTVVATNSAKIKQTLLKYHELTSDAPVGGVDWQVHDFGFRGVGDENIAGLAGMAHLTSFNGSDTTVGDIFACTLYDAVTIPSMTIPASEHSTATPFGLDREGEMAYLRNMLVKFPTGPVATVGDSNDIINFIENIAGSPELKEMIVNRDGLWVCRPDSGDPVVTTERVAYALWRTFGGTVNSKGYKVLIPQVRFIQGDGIDLASIDKIASNLMAHGFSIENIAFGSGGGLLQKFDRDTLKNAIKCSFMILSDGTEVDVRKNPMEFDKDGNYIRSFKQSKAGELALIRDDAGDLKTVTTVEAGDRDLLKTVFYLGDYVGQADNSWEQIKARIAKDLHKV